MSEFAIIDIETTGGRVTDDRITEIAIYIHNGTEVIDSFHSLINPERSIPAYISQMTGITDDMVAAAPRFFEVAKEIVKITQGRVFVAHNVHFDYSFVKNEFKSLGFNFQRKTLCTVRLSRKLFPNLPSYSLGKLCNSLSISIKNRHRAQGDAAATAELFGMLMEKNTDKVYQSVIDEEIKSPTLPPKINQAEFEALPEETGVYYFYDESGEIIYVGKSKNIKKRVASHFGTNLKSSKTIELKNKVASIGHEILGSELVALLYESDEIKRHKPLFNRAQRRSRFPFGIFVYEDKAGYLRFNVDKVVRQFTTPVVMTESAESARRLLYNRIQEYKLCMKLCNLYKTKSACFDYHIQQCAGACIQAESAEDYNVRVQQAMLSFGRLAPKSFIIVGSGRQKGEKSIVCIERGRYLGFGFLDESIAVRDFEEAKSYIKRYADNQDIQKILVQWLKEHQSGVLAVKE
jgi:DNA polymerase-3 subunit epsilon